MRSIGRGDVARRIARRDCRRDITIRGQHRSRNIHTPGFTVGIHRRLVSLGTDFHRDRITRFHVVIDFTGHRNRLAGLGRVNHVIAGDIVNRDRRNWRNGINTISVIGIHGSDVTRRIARGDRSRDIAIGCQHSARNIHAPGLAIGIHRRLVSLGTDCHRNRIARFDFIANLTRHRNGLAGLAGIDDVVSGDIVDRDRRHWRNGIDAICVTGIGGSDVACGIARGHGGTHITVRGQHGTRNIDAPGLAVGIHRRLVRFRADGNGDRIARFNFIADLTGDGNGLTRFAGVNHVIRRDIINSD